MKKIISVLAFLFTFVSAFSCKPDNRPGEVHGTVSYRDREVADIVVSYTGDNGTYTYTTNKSGYYVIRGIPAGDYIVSVSYNGKNVDSYLKDYEKSENPSRVTILVNGYHVRNIIIPNDQDLGWDDEDEDDDEDDTTLPDAEIPILAWYSIPAAYATAERFQELKDCGFTLSFSHTTTQEEAILTLDCAEQAGIKVIVPCPEANTEAFVQAVKDKPALYGYCLRDEPKTEELAGLGELADRILALDSEHNIYFNLFPNYVGDEALGSTYEEYVKQSIQKVKANQVSFDFYPIRETGIVSSWWENLEIVKKYSQEADLPFWAFALCTSHKPYPIPELSHLRLQMYMNLAYGAQGLQYFTYWCPTPGTWDFHDAPIAEDGTPTEVYDLVQEMNDELQARAGVFMGCKVTGVYQTGDHQPNGTSPLTGYNPPLSRLNLNGGEATVSFFENGKWAYLMLVNRSYQSEYDYSIIFEKDVQMVNRDGTVENIGTSLDSHMEAGDCAIFRWKK